jgi:hypothetical protein
VSKPAPKSPDGDPQLALRQRLLALRASLDALFARRLARRGPAWAQSRTRLLLGLELMWKLEEQLLLPALHPAPAPTQSGLAEARREIEQLRDLAESARQAPDGHQDVLMAALDGLASQHFLRVDELLEGAGPADWAAMRDETDALLERWEGEVQAHGEIEDEDRDPVGLPPR